MTVLAVDDDADDLWMLKEAIQEIDASIFFATANSCKEALHYLENNKIPEYLFLDINMPMMTGIDCLKMIRKRSIYKEITMIIMSTKIRDEDLSNCKELNAGCFEKPPVFGSTRISSPPNF